MKVISLIVLIVAALAVSIYAEPITVKVKYEKDIQKVELDTVRNSVIDIILEWKRQSKMEGNFKLKYGWGKELDEAKPIEHTNIKDGSTVTIVKA